MITPEARDGNFTNEGGVCGSTRLLKNIGGLWLLQACRRAWAASGLHIGYEELLAASANEPAFRSLFDPDHHALLHPVNMLDTISEYCRQTRQEAPARPAAYARAIFESLALKYRMVVESLEEIRSQHQRDSNRGRRREEPSSQSVHGGCDGATVIAGPVEATALGNIAMQMLATGGVRSLSEAREVIERSFPTNGTSRARPMCGTSVRALPGILELTVSEVRDPAAELALLDDLWREQDAAALERGRSTFSLPIESSRRRSRITNFGGGNTSSKFELPDPLTGQPTRVLAVKGSGGDLRSIGTAGFAILYLDKLDRLVGRYGGEAHEDEMVGMYPLCSFGDNRVAASIDTPLHAFLPFAHVDHLHPDWAIALAASANGRQKLDEFNAAFRRRIVWIPWQRPGFELRSCCGVPSPQPWMRRNSARQPRPFTWARVSATVTQTASAPSTRWERL